MANVKYAQRGYRNSDGGGDVPGLNPAIRALTIRALREGFQVIGLRHGWAGLVEMCAKTNTTTPTTFRS